MFHDLLGICEGHGARFVKRYADLLRTRWSPACAPFADDVRDAAATPRPSTRYSIDPDELERFRERWRRLSRLTSSCAEGAGAPAL